MWNEKIIRKGNQYNLVKSMGHIFHIVTYKIILKILFIRIFYYFTTIFPLFPNILFKKESIINQIIIIFLKIKKIINIFLILKEFIILIN